MSPAKIPFAMGRVVTHPPIVKTTATPMFDIPFSAVRGGTLTVEVTVQTSGKTLQAKVSTQIQGTNPTSGDLRKQGANTNFIKLIEQETGLRQFRASGHAVGMPLFSADKLGGVGLGQITHPRPTDDQIWNWKSNLAAALSLFQTKEAEAETYLKSVGKSAAFTKLAQQYNLQRAAKKLKPLTMTLPYTSDQLELETIRRYNGEPEKVHEFELAKDAQGNLVVIADEVHATGEAQWTQVSGAERRKRYTADKLPAKKWGDPDYVDHVQAQP